MECLNMIVVDDEPLAVDYLMNLIEWKNFGFKIIKVVHSGQKALEVLDNVDIDLVITDIQMPGMDGIELVELAQRKNVQSKFLLLSAYSDFDYAKTALSLGVIDYMLKSELNKQFLENKMTDIYTRLSNEMYEKQKAEKSMVVEQFLSPQGDNELLRLSLGISKHKGTMLVLIPKLQTLIPLKKTLNIQVVEDENEYNMHLKECKREIQTNAFTNYFLDYSFKMPNDVIVLIFQEKKIPLEYQKNIWLSGLKLEVEMISKQFGDFFILFTKDSYNLESLSSSYRELSIVLESLVFLDKSIIEIQEYIGLTLHHSKKYELEKTSTGINGEKFRYALSDNNFEEVKSILEEEWETIYRIKSYSRLSNNINYLNSLIKKIYDNNQQQYCLEEYKNNSEHKNICYALLDYYIALFKEYIDWNRKVVQKNYTREVAKAIEYINNNYTNSEISVNEIGEEVGLSSSRLSVLFRNETGVTIMHYVTSRRIERAKTHLKKGNLKIKEIAEIVGYNSSQYFSQVFYKTVGVQPTEYGSEGRCL